MEKPNYGNKQKPELILRLINRALKHGFTVKTRLKNKGWYYEFHPPTPWNGVVDMPVNTDINCYVYTRKGLNKRIRTLKRENIKALIREYLEANHDGVVNLKIALKELNDRGHKIL